MPHSTTKSPLHRASSALEAIDISPHSRRIQWNILRNTLLTHLFATPYILLLDLVAVHRLKGTISSDPSAVPYTVALVPSCDEYIDISLLKMTNTNSKGTEAEANMIDWAWIESSKKRELIWRILMRSERMRDNVLGAADGETPERMCTLGGYLLEVMKRKFEEGGSMGRGGRRGPLAEEAGELARRGSEVSMKSGTVERAVQLPMREMEIL